MDLSGNESLYQKIPSECILVGSDSSQFHFTVNHKNSGGGWQGCLAEFSTAMGLQIIDLLQLAHLCFL